MRLFPPVPGPFSPGSQRGPSQIGQTLAGRPATNLTWRSPPTAAAGEREVGEIVEDDGETDSCSVDKGGGVQMVRAEERGRGVIIRRAHRLQDAVQREKSIDIQIM